MAAGVENSANDDVARRLTADVVGYSRLMADDEVGALNQLKALRGTVVDPLVARHRGEIVGSAGDSFLVAFLPWSYAFVTIAKLNLGDMKGAKSFLARFEAASKVSVENLIRTYPWTPAVAERLLADLNKIAEGA